MRVPAFAVMSGTTPVFTGTNGRGVSLTIHDGVGFESDSLTVVADDPRCYLMRPRSGQRLAVFVGYQGGPMTFRGTYIVDEGGRDGWPQSLVIEARAADNLQSLKKRRTEGHEKTTVGGLASKLAGRNGLAPRVSGALAGKEIRYLGQAEESDISLLTRYLRSRFDAVVTPKDGNLVVAERGSGLSVSGLPLGNVSIAPGKNLIGYSTRWRDKPKHSEVEAGWFDRQAVKRQPVIEAGGTDGPLFRMRSPFPDETEARDYAASLGKQLARAEATAMFEIEGEPNAFAERLAICAGVGVDVDGTWLINDVTLVIDDSGFSTTLDCELPG
ncbi:MAG: hypothetical protein H6879_09040 [Rhodobiaceae bacterium]|nr:hypothetical protein [Rhodobiaceae bacterium]